MLVCLSIPKNNTCSDSECLSLTKDEHQANIDSLTNIVTSGIGINKEINKFKKFVSYAISQITSQNSEITRLGGDFFFLKSK